MKKKFLSVAMTLAMVIALLPALPAQAAMKTVTVSNAEELLAAIASDTKIILEPGKYEIKYRQYRTEPFYSNSGKKYYGDFSLLIYDIENLELYGNGQAEITVDVGFLPVISVRNSNNISFSGMTLGHDVPSYSCEDSGYVFSLIDCNGVTIENCDMYGCGILGIDSNDTNGITISNSLIRDCSEALHERLYACFHLQTDGF